MGADLILYTVVGNETYNFKELRSELERLYVKKREEVYQLFLTYKEEKEITEEQDVLIETLGIFDEEDAKKWMEANDILSVMKEVEEFCKAWPNLGRDTSARGYKDKVIVSCGERTWGDEPDGPGFQYVKLIDQLGLWEAFGFE